MNIIKEAEKTGYRISREGVVIGIMGQEINHYADKGLLRVCMYALTDQKVKASVYVHRLVAMKYVPNPENKKCVRHIDGNHMNNHADNLRWLTYKESSQEAFKRGTRTNNHAKRIVFDVAREIHYESVKLAAEANGIERDKLSRMLRGAQYNETALAYAQHIQ